MPPKKKAGPGPSKKSAEKQKDKTLEDKTFGLKNKKKSKNVQKFIQEVTKQVKGNRTSTEVIPLADNDRVEELAAMLGTQGDSGKQSARELLTEAGQHKQAQSNTRSPAEPSKQPRLL